jgi:LITAF-like zinc ribbon domain
MFWFSTPKKDPEQPQPTDIEIGIIPVLSSDDFKRIQYSQEQKAVPITSCKTIVPMMPPSHPIHQGPITAPICDIEQKTNIITSNLPLVDATPIPCPPAVLEVIPIPCPPVMLPSTRATAPPEFYDTTTSSALQAYDTTGPVTAPERWFIQRKLLHKFRIRSRYPVLLNPCPRCGAKARTITITSPSWITWLMVIGLLLLFWPIFWIPLLVDSCKRTRHYCSVCSGEVGELEALSDCCVHCRGH